MKINMAQINNQVRQLRDQATRLRSAQNSLQLYQRSLNSHWRGAEMTPTNQAIDTHARRLSAAAAELDAISSEIIMEAERIRREEEL